MENPTPQQQDKQSRWVRWQRGQALLEYWPTIPAAVTVMITAAALVGPVKEAFQQTADGLNNVVCEEPSAGPVSVDLDGGHRIEVIASNYDEENDRTTVSFRVQNGGSPDISHWVLGIDEPTAAKIVAWSEPFENWGLDPTTGKYGIKFDTGYGGGGGGNGKGNGQSVVSPLTLAYAPLFSSHNQAVLRAIYSPRLNVYSDEREIVLTLTGRVDFVEQIEVTTKAGSTQVSSGYVNVPSVGSTIVETC